MSVGLLRGAGEVAAKARQYEWRLIFPGVYACIHQWVGEQQPE